MKRAVYRPCRILRFPTPTTAAQRSSQPAGGGARTQTLMICVPSDAERLRAMSLGNKLQVLAYCAPSVLYNIERWVHAWFAEREREIDERH